VAFEARVKLALIEAVKGEVAGLKGLLADGQKTMEVRRVLADAVEEDLVDAEALKAA
jgi:hypothetical protein